MVACAAWIAVAAGGVWLLDSYAEVTVTVLWIGLLASLPLVIGGVPGLWRRRADPPPAPKSDLDRRRGVWLALSTLYLDTELDDRDHQRIARELIASGYSGGQLEEILYREVHPVLLANLLSVAGVWDGFDPRWLEDQILRRTRRVSGFGVVWEKRLVQPAWSAIEDKMRERRS